MNFKSWLLAFRLKTLTAAVVPIAGATALVHLHQKNIQWHLVALMLVAAVSIQIATNLFNDAIDFKKGADKERVGPVRVTQSGLISEKAVYLMALAFCLVALACGSVIVAHAGWPLVIVGLLSLFLAYGYTGGPWPLAYLGLGDLFVILFFGVIAVGGSYYVLTLEWSWAAMVLGLQIGFLSTVLIAINNLRDSRTDAVAGKKTLAVRWGDGFAVAEIITLIAVTYLLVNFWVFAYNNLAFYSLLLTLPIAFKIIARVRKSDDKKNLLPALGMAALLHMSFGALFCLVGVL